MAARQCVLWAVLLAVCVTWGCSRGKAGGGTTAASPGGGPRVAATAITADDLKAAEQVTRDRRVDVTFARCPACSRLVISLMVYRLDQAVPMPVPTLVVGLVPVPTSIGLVYPRCAARPPIPEQVPADIAEDYSEAALVLADSPKASAALSRRCLQAVLREGGNTESRDLAPQIGEVLDTGTLPSHIADDLDAVRNIGNFAAHPTKSQSTGEIVSVEPGEAEWNLDVLDLLFDHYYVQPAKAKARRDALNAKLGDVGKSPIKRPPSAP
jgi:hypothetical protein